MEPVSSGAIDWNWKPSLPYYMDYVYETPDGLALKSNRKRVNLTMTLEECNYYTEQWRKQLMEKMAEASNIIAERSMKGVSTYARVPYI